MSAASNRALIQRFYDEGWNGNNLDVYDELVTDDFVDHQAIPGLPAGREGFKQLNVMFKSAFPDVWVDVDNIVAEDDKVACRWTSTGTHTGQFIEFPPSGKHAQWRSVGFFRVEDGKIREHWGIPDLLGLLIQIGVIPPPNAESATGTLEAQVQA
jgi:steroid delta-isomerase-like uncharacterized protein